MENRAAFCIGAVIGYIESHLDGKLDLDTVAAAAGYSKYHLHRMFTETAGLTMHEYIQRRRLTEAAKLLVEFGYPTQRFVFTPFGGAENEP